MLSVRRAHHAHQCSAMICLKINIVVAAIAVSSVFAQYDTYEARDEEDNDEDQPKVDYSKYFGGLGGAIGPASAVQAADDSAGFVQPLDFTGFFAGGHFGLDGLAGGASQQVFQTPSGINVALPISGVGFPLHRDQAASNISGFVNNNVNFQSLFDTSSSPSEHGFRPQDFISRGTQTEGTTNRGFYSPAFASLQRDVDREVDYQRKEEAAVEQSRAANRRLPVEDDEEEENDDYDPEYEFDEPSILDPSDRSPQKYTKQPYEENVEDRSGQSNNKQVSYQTPYSRVNQYHHPRSETRPVKKTQRKPLPTLSDFDEDDVYPSSVPNNKGYNHQDLYPKPKPFPPKNAQRNYPITRGPVKQSYNDNSKHIHGSQPYGYSSNLPPIKSYAHYQNEQPRKFASSSKLPITRSSRIHSDFRPSPRDPYLDNIHKTPYDRSLGTPKTRQPSRESIYPLPQTEFATVIHNTPKQQSKASKNNNNCQRIHKRIDPKDFSRFKRQQMTCYICTNKEKGNTYEECSYESDPKENSFYKGSAEAYSSDTILTPKTFHKRERRSTMHSHNRYLNHKHINLSPLIRNIRQLERNIHSERGHGPENYRFGPEYFQDDGDAIRKKPLKDTQVRRYDDEEDYDEGDTDEESDIEKEYQPPGIAENDSCHKVKKNGLICMVCENAKSGGSYEQCSYASDPDENRYEYAKHTTYGSKRRPNSERYKRYAGKIEKRNTDSHNMNKHYPRRPFRHNKTRKVDRENSEFKNGKLKRKKVMRDDDSKRRIGKSETKRKSVKTAKEEEMPGVVGLDPFFYGNSDTTYNPDDYDDRGRKIKRKDDESYDDEAEATSVEDETEEADPTYEESFFRLFPELVGTDPYTGESISRNKKETEDDVNYPAIPYEEEDEEESESTQKHKTVKPDDPYNVQLPSYYFDDDESKKDLEKALDEFTHKNRSECKKVMREKMTCYQCVDKNGLQHEECMFVAASEPKSKHLAYHEVKEFRVAPNDTDNSTNDPVNDSKNSSRSGIYELKQPLSKRPHNTGIITPPLLSKNLDPEGKREISKESKISKKRKPKKFFKIEETEGQTTELPILMVTDSEGQPALMYDILKINPKNIETHSVIPTHISRDTNISFRKKRKPQDCFAAEESKVHTVETEVEEDDRNGNTKPQDEENEENRRISPKTRPNYNSVPPDPEGFDEREGPEGAYSHETEPVYDSILKITLPKYMLTRSEHEDIFDEVFRSG